MVSRPKGIVVNARLASGPKRSPTKLGLPGRGGQLWWDDRAAALPPLAEGRMCLVGLKWPGGSSAC